MIAIPEASLAEPLRLEPAESKSVEFTEKKRSGAAPSANPIAEVTMSSEPVAANPAVRPKTSEPPETATRTPAHRDTHSLFLGAGLRAWTKPRLIGGGVVVALLLVVLSTGFILLLQRPTVSPADAAESRRVLADAARLSQSGDRAGAILLLDKAIALDPTNADAYYSRGLNRCQLGWERRVFRGGDDLGQLARGRADLAKAAAMKPAFKKEADELIRNIDEVWILEGRR
jgi:hypothetical protein